MQLARFNCLVDHILQDHDLSVLTQKPRVYRLYGNSWYNQEGNVVDDVVIVRNLNLTRGRVGPWRERNGCEVFLPVKDLDVVVVATFWSPPRKPTYTRVDTIIQRCLQRSQDAFDADHDPLTGLLNRRGFEKERSTLGSVNALDHGSLETPALVLASMDLDFFKQVNDSFGHD
jgi:GGDEF domain-containing protein